MDYAILKTGGKQYKVKSGDVIDVEKLPAGEGAVIELTEVLAVSRGGQVTLGQPLVPGAKVLAEVQQHFKADKLLIFKYKAKTRYRRKRGHRQPYSRLAIKDLILTTQESPAPLTATTPTPGNEPEIRASGEVKEKQE